MTRADTAFPAHAGMNRVYVSLGDGMPRVPRPRGDEPPVAAGNIEQRVRSPPTRG